ncbi:hypothetical protein BGW39_000049 [Mortierella sp. 14UC]|nr:hypothetical protein BGW39_000049 [Mortierella sp. 14UC]
MFLITRIRPLAGTIPRTAATASSRPVWAARGFQYSALRFNTSQEDTKPTAGATASTSSEETSAAAAGKTEPTPAPASKGEIIAKAYDFPWCYNGSSHLTRIPHYPYAKAPKVWALLGWVPQSIQYAICKSASGLAIHKLLPLLSTNVDRDALADMMTQELYDRYESELEMQEQLGSDVSIKLASVHDGMIKDVWVLLGPKLKSGTSRGFIRWRWQSLTVALRAATDQMSSRDQVAQMMMEGVQFKVDVEFDATIDYTIHSKVLDTDVVSDFTRRPLLVRFETPFFEPAEKMVASRSMSRPHEAPIDWHWRVSDIDYLLEQEFIERRIKEDIKDEEHAQREMEM